MIKQKDLKYVLWKWVCHRGVSPKGRVRKIVSYVCVNVTIRCGYLNIPPLSEYQDFLFEKITELQNEGLGYRRIGHWLNEHGYKTPRGHEFKSAHVHSILKKEDYEKKELTNRMN